MAEAESAGAHPESIATERIKSTHIFLNIGFLQQFFYSCPVSQGSSALKDNAEV
jgi:hypothetical protein